jgi:hypothetical protein
MGAKWTPEEDRRLTALWATDLRIVDFAVQLPGRSPDAIEKRGATVLKLGDRKKWSPEEEKIVLAIWFEIGPLKSLGKRLPGRTVESIRQFAARIGLPTDRGSLKSCRFSWVEDAIRRELEKGRPFAAHELAEVTGVSVDRARQVLAKGLKERSYHVDKWVRRSVHGQWAAAYLLGDGKDAPRPAAKTKAKTAHDCYWRKKGAPSKANPFAAALGLVQAPSGQPGRVFIHLTDSPEEMEVA